jgi:hypothetical protein
MSEPVPSTPKKKTRTLPRWFTERDWPLMGLLLLLNCGSLYTTVSGARQILPWPMSDILGFAIQGMLFILLAGFAAAEAPLRKWTVITVFACAAVYASFFTYYRELAGEADDKAQLDVALQAHAILVSAIYQPAVSRIESLGRQAEAKFELAEREASRGSTSGVTGYGPLAKKYAAEASALKVEAEGLQADLDRVKPLFEYPIEGLTPDDVYRKDLEAWSAAPKEWKEGVPMPDRGTYVDLKAQVALLTPYQRIRDGDMAAITALSLAGLVDGIAVFLGTAIHARAHKKTWTEVLTEQIAAAKASSAMLKTAIDRPGLSDPREKERQLLLEDALQVVDLRIAGRGSDFLTTFYQAIHPETGALDFSGLQRHPNATYRIAARMLVDQLRNPQLGWVTVDNGWWAVPEDLYPKVTAWLGEQIRRECELEAASAGPPDAVREPDRTLRLVFPAS